MAYQIIAKIAAADTYGCSVYDWFDGDALDREFETADEAERGR